MCTLFDKIQKQKLYKNDKINVHVREDPIVIIWNIHWIQMLVRFTKWLYKTLNFFN